MLLYFLRLGIKIELQKNKRLFYALIFLKPLCWLNIFFVLFEKSRYAIIRNKGMAL